MFETVRWKETSQINGDNWNNIRLKPAGIFEIKE
jgi:hypothetical protein